MGLFDKFKTRTKLEELNISDDDIVAVADGKLIDVSNVSDAMFANKLLGDSIAFTYSQDKVTICSPANGTLMTLFPTGHAFGVKRSDGVEILVHIGVNTVDTNGDGFKIENHKQNDVVKAGEPIVTVDMKKLSKTYDMSTMLIITDANGIDIQFIEPSDVKRGQSIIK